MRISDWSSDVCSSDLLANHIIGQFADNLRKEIGAMAEAQESRASASTSASEAGAGQSPDSRGSESAGASAQVQRAKPISGLRLGIWLIWRQDRKSTRLNSSH